MSVISKENVRLLSAAASLVRGYVVRAALVLGAQFLRIAKQALHRETHITNAYVARIDQ